MARFAKLPTEVRVACRTVQTWLRKVTGLDRPAPRPPDVQAALDLIREFEKDGAQERLRWPEPRAGVSDG